VIGERASVGLGVHARSVVGAALDGLTGEVLQRRLTLDLAEEDARMTLDSWTSGSVPTEQSVLWWSTCAHRPDRASPLTG